MEIKNLNLVDYIKVYDSVIEERVLETFLEICKDKKYVPGLIGGNTKGILNTNIRKADLWNLSNKDKSLTTVNWYNFFRYFFSLKHEEYMLNFKNDIIPLIIPKINEIQILKYEVESHYTFHTDQSPNSNRQWSSIFFANEDYEGGDLIISTPDGGARNNIKKKKNRLVIWPSNFMYPHTVLPVTKGIRYTIVSWAQ